MLFLFNKLKNIYHPTLDTTERDTGAINAEEMGKWAKSCGHPLENVSLSQDRNLLNFSTNITLLKYVFYIDLRSLS